MNLFAKKPDEHLTIAQMITPTNLEDEKRKFLFDENYNPQFEYAQEIPESVLTKYGDVSSEHLQFAINTLEHVKKNWKTEGAYLDDVEGPMMKREEVEKQLHAYLATLGLDKKVRVFFSYSYIARTSVQKDLIRIRLPIEYREKSFLGTLHHEIGTHMLRRINEEKQPWFEKHAEFGLHPYMDTEEGLAVLHQLIPLSQKLLRFESLRYLAVYLGSTSSFSSVFQQLEPYMEDKLRRWNTCVRVKRGIKDTSKAGAFTRDQAYLRWGIHVLHWLEQHHFDLTPLYFGKLAVEDLEKAMELSPSFQPTLPSFYTDDPNAYKANMIAIQTMNETSKM